MAKKEITTVGYYRLWKSLHCGLWSSKFVAPCVPAVIITSINWDEWFVHSGASLPFGFSTLLLAVLSTIIAMSYKDKILQEKLSPIWTIALVMSIWAIAFMFLANIFQQIGQMLLWTVAGIVGSAAIDQTDKSLAKQRVDEYKGYITDNKLSKREQKREERRKKAEEEARKEAEAHQATE